MGIFPRLLSKIVTQMQRVDGLDIQDEAIKLAEDSAKLEMERCQFSCSLDFEHGCIRVGFWGPDPPNRLVLLLLKEMADEVLREMKGHLDCAFAVAVHDDDKSHLLWWGAIQEAANTFSELRVKGTNISADLIQKRYSMWQLDS